MSISRRIWLGILLPACLGLLSACGGGGGGGATNTPPPGSFTLSTTNVSFSGKYFGLPPASQKVTLHVTGSGAAAAGAAYASGETPANWLTVTSPPAGAGPDFTFTLAISSTALTAGTYTTVLTFGTADANGNVLQSQPVQISYSVWDGVLISATSVSTSLVVGESLTSESINFPVNTPSSVQWTATSNMPWLAPPGGTQSGSGLFSFTINMAGYGAGTYTGILTLTNAANPADTASLPVIITMEAPTLTATPTSLTLGGATGLDTSAQTLTFSVDTYQSVYPWTATVTTSNGGSWLTLSASSGTVSGSNSTITVNANRSNLAAGSYQGQIQLQTTIGNSVLTQNIPVTLNVDVNQLVANATGVAFSSFPSRSVLTRTLNVTDTWGATGVHWQTQSDQSWLTATSSGTTGTPLVLTANTTGLTPGQYTAHVTITSPDTGVSNQETVRVGLTVGSTDPAALISLSSVTGSVIVTSPVEPVAFVTTGGAGAPIYVYDLNAGTLLNTFTSGFTTPGNLAISGDGLTLYVADNTTGSWAIRALNALTGALESSYPFTSTTYNPPQLAGYPQLAYARPDTHPILLCPWTGEAFDLTTTGVTYPVSTQFIGIADYAMAVSPDQSTLYQMAMGLSPAGVSAYNMTYSTLPGVGLLTTLTAQNNGASAQLANAAEIAVSADGTTLYTASGAPYDFEVFNASLVQQTTLAAAPYPVSVTTSWNGLVAGGIANGSNSAGDIWIYDSQGALLQQALSNPNGTNDLTPRSLNFSGDGTRLTSISGAGLEIRATPVPQ